jgi:uncharacterized membrane protein YfcA
MTLKLLLNQLAGSPKIRAAITVIAPVVLGVVSGAYVNQITERDHIAWSKSPHVLSFWLLVILMWLWLRISRAFLAYDQALERHTKL